MNSLEVGVRKEKLITIRGLVLRDLPSRILSIRKGRSGGRGPLRITNTTVERQSRMDTDDGSNIYSNQCRRSSKKPVSMFDYSTAALC